MIWYILSAIMFILGLICLTIPLLRNEVNRALRNVLVFGGCALMASSACFLTAAMSI